MNRTITYIVVLFFVLFTNFTFAQSKVVLGKVVAKTRDLEGIYVKNVNTNKGVSTQKGGYFSIEASPNDTLVISAIHLIGREKVLTYTDMNKSLVFVPMQFADTVLDELVIDRTITSESLGFGKVKRLTPAQRRLHTATSSGGGIIPVDLIVNAISGRTKMLEKAVALEQEYIFAEKLLNKFPSDFYTQRLQIPEQYYMAFGYFIAQDPVIVTSYQTVADTQLSLMYTEKATEFLEILRVLK
ncbi:hypothetical protein H1R17_00665 [Flavobacterium sp. xlx-214]|uniref:hypothetical protein n=1 Tax=unclassified Flavobacterium TaxID=196869 RepID=UPI0013D6B83C|nr:MULTISPECIES: hypothetical protein [unclassified Flavobacterium]MBA5794063.1 hypothetical protein [Flavobacterium sp. xlx-221]QMI83689.1 hypothetical protein H1R17_00665 [Flavobacterium sp. xlx-214]